MDEVWRVRLHTGDKALEERLVGEIFIVLLKVLLGWGDQLQGNQLVSCGGISNWMALSGERMLTLASRIVR
jgi:hypothetical protein